MTLETAKRIIQEQGEFADKEARAVVRGWMVICERAEDGRRTYPRIKVMPTGTDTESSIEAALKNHHERKRLSIARTVTINSLPIYADTKPSTPIQTTIDFPKESEKQSLPPSFLERVKKRIIEIWKEIDSIVEE